jgi:hypothetical protein
MKTQNYVLLVLSALTLTAQAQTTSLSTSPHYTVADRGPFWRTWQRTNHLTNYVTGATFDSLEQYVELDNGACYLGRNGEWLDSQDLIEITPNGAAAVHGPTKAYFSPNLNTLGAIKLVTASGQTFKSHPLGLYYRDVASGQVALIAPIQDTIGVLVPPNRIVFSNAFSGLKASVILTYAHNGFEQSVVLSEAPPPPDLLAGFPVASSRLEIWTALDQWPSAQQVREVTVKQGVNGEADLVDQLLFFADTWLPVGTAFSVGSADEPVPGQPAQIRVFSPFETNHVPTGKSVQQIGNQKVLVESANYENLQLQLRALQGAALPEGRFRADQALSEGRELPASSLAKVPNQPLQLASVSAIPRGLLLDYVNPLSGSQSSFTFSNGWTYIISNSFQVGSGTATFQPNTCVKYMSNAYLILYGPVSFPTSGALDTFTSADDNEWGAQADSSTGYPYYAAKRAIWMYYDANYTDINNCRIRWSQTGIEEDENCGVYNYPLISYTTFQNCNTTLSASVCNDTLTVSHVTKCQCNGSSGYYSGTITTDCELNMVGNGGFAGMNGSAGSDQTANPADTDGAVGPTHFMELLNFKIAVYEKSSGNQLATLDNTTFFKTTNNGTVYPTGTPFDGRVLYDQQSSAWVACAIDSGSQKIMFAYKNGSSPLPLNSWTTEILSLDKSGDYSDSSTLGIDANGVYVSLLRFYYNGSGIAVLDDNIVACLAKPGVYQGSTSMTSLDVPNTDLQTWKVQTAINLDSSPLGGWVWCIAKSFPSGTGSSYTNGSIYYRRIQWSSGTNLWVDSSWQPLSASGAPEYYDFDDWTSSTPNAPEGSGCSTGLGFQWDGGRLHMAMIRNNILWTCQQVGLNGTSGSYNGNDTGSAVDRSGIQWWQLQCNSSGTPLTYTRSGIVYDNSTSNPWWYYFPSLAINWQNDVVLGFSGSSAVNDVTALYTWMMSNGTKLGSNITIEAGSACGLNRMGDYSFTTVDPVDNQTIWTIQEYATSEGSGRNWSDWIIAIQPGP